MIWKLLILLKTPTRLLINVRTALPLLVEKTNIFNFHWFSPPQFSVSPISPEEQLERPLKLNAPELLLLTSSLRATSLPFDLNASSRGKSLDTSQAEIYEGQINSSQDSLEIPILPHIIIIPTSETTLSEEQSLTENIEEENIDLYSAPDKNYLLLKGRLHSSTGPVEKLVT